MSRTRILPLVFALLMGLALWCTLVSHSPSASDDTVSVEVESLHPTELQETVNVSEGVSGEFYSNELTVNAAVSEEAHGEVSKGWLWPAVDGLMAQRHRRLQSCTVPCRCGCCGGICGACCAEKGAP